MILQKGEPCDTQKVTGPQFQKGHVRECRQVLGEPPECAVLVGEHSPLPVEPSSLSIHQALP